MTLPALLAAFAGMIVHEFAHAWVAKLEGDPTPCIYGRCTVNPIPHIDPIGSVALPLLMLYSVGVPVGWFRPVPLSNELIQARWGRARVLLAGPAANLLCALGCLAVGFRDGALANVSLACFNLLPIPPLDGGLVLREVIG